jgi:hypothetical protein
MSGMGKIKGRVSYVFQESWISVLFYPSLGIIDGMIVIGSIVWSRIESFIGTWDLGFHEGEGEKVSRLILTPFLCKNTVKSLPDPRGTGSRSSSASNWVMLTTPLFIFEGGPVKGPSSFRASHKVLFASVG